MMVSDQELDALLKRLHLANPRRTWRDLRQRAGHENWTGHDFRTLLVTEEIAHRKQMPLERVACRARCPFLKTIVDFTLSIDRAILAPRRRAVGRLHDREHRVIFNGKPGLGKTPLAIAIAIAYGAIQRGFDPPWTW
jgi:DNA replication protein DnaC